MGKSKSKKQISTFLGLISFVLGIVALLLFALLPMLKMTIQNVGEGTLGGFGMIFGGTVNAVSGDVSEEIDGIAVNVVALIAFIILALGLIAVAVGTFKKSKIKLLKMWDICKEIPLLIPKQMERRGRFINRMHK